MSEWRRYLKWTILILVAGLGIMEVCSSNEMGAPNASHLEQKTTQPNRPKQTKISPGKRPCVYECRVNSRIVGYSESFANPLEQAPGILTSARARRRR